MNLIKFMKNEEREMRDKSRPKSCVMLSALTSDAYGKIPNLRSQSVSDASRMHMPSKMVYLRSLQASRKRNLSIDEHLKNIKNDLTLA